METQDFVLKEFECGCRFTEAHLCPTAAELWENTQSIYASAQLGIHSWDQYAAAQQAYYDHYKDLGG